MLGAHVLHVNEPSCAPRCVRSEAAASHGCSARAPLASKHWRLSSRSLTLRDRRPPWKSAAHHVLVGAHGAVQAAARVLGAQHAAKGAGGAVLGAAALPGLALPQHCVWGGA